MLRVPKFLWIWRIFQSTAEDFEPSARTQGSTRGMPHLESQVEYVLGGEVQNLDGSARRVNTATHHWIAPSHVLFVPWLPTPTTIGPVFNRYPQSSPQNRDFLLYLTPDEG